MGTKKEKRDQTRSESDDGVVQRKEKNIRRRKDSKNKWRAELFQRTF